MRVVGNGGFNGDKCAKLRDCSCGGSGCIGVGNVEEEEDEQEEQPHFRCDGNWEGRESVNGNGNGSV